MRPSLFCYVKGEYLMDLETLKGTVSYYTRLLREEWSKELEDRFFEILSAYDYEDIVGTLARVTGDEYRPLKNFIRYYASNGKEGIRVFGELGCGPTQATDDFDDGISEAINDAASQGKDVRSLIKLASQINRRHRYFNFPRAVVRNCDDSIIEESMNNWDNQDYDYMVGVLVDYILEAHHNTPQRLTSIIRMVGHKANNLEDVYFTYIVYNWKDQGILTKILHPYLDWNEVETLSVDEYGEDHDITRFVVRAADMIDV